MAAVTVGLCNCCHLLILSFLKNLVYMNLLHVPCSDAQVCYKVKVKVIL